MLPFESYDVNISDYENDLLKKTIENHKKRWDVIRPKKWNRFTDVDSNILFLSKEKWGQNSPELTFETLMYNHVYDLIDGFVEKYYPENFGKLFHTKYSWYMYYEGERTFPVHNHLFTQGVKHDPPPMCCGSYYVDIPEDGERLFNIYDKSPYDDGGGKIIQTLKPQPKQLYLFDAALQHEPVQKNTQNSGITIAFNAFLVE